MTREHWCRIAFQIGHPVLDALATRTFKQRFPDQKPTARLEAFVRVLVGLAPWLEHGHQYEPEARELGELARKALDSATNPSSPDFVNISVSSSDQVLVESALLAQALLRAPHQLWGKLSSSVKTNVINTLRVSRAFPPHDNNWVLFPSIIEAFFMKIGEPVNHVRLMEGLTLYQQGWYAGDGVYCDGDEFHSDYYNSFIIHPMLIDILDVVKSISLKLQHFAMKEDIRLQRWATIQERCIASDGTFPPIGRSITYRTAAFHGLALCAYRNNLHAILKPSQVRCVLTRVIKATLQHPNTFENSWLTIGLYGKQPNLAEPYINHGSVYICSTVFVTLGLSPSDPFWEDEDMPSTWEQLVNGSNEIARDIPHVEADRKHGCCV